MFGNLPIINLLVELVILAAEFVATLMDSYNNYNVVSALEAPRSCDVSGADLLSDSVFEPTIACELTRTHGAEALILLRKYDTLFGFKHSELGVAEHVEHAIATGKAMPCRQRPYCVVIA